MVDFNKLGKLVAQRDIVVALAKARVCRRILVVTASHFDTDRVSLEIWEKLKEHGWPEFNRKIKVIKDFTGKGFIKFLDCRDTYSAKGKCFDLLWIKHWDGSISREGLERIKAQVTAGYNPMILEGDITYE